jgi:hypothetical protein
MSDKAITADLLERLRRNYIKPGQDPAGGVFIPECGWNGGVSTSRCDALYIGFTSTSGRTLIGHEIKASRADWLHELNQPGKADAWADQCHAWYVVAPSLDVVHIDELPAGWGLLTPGASRTRMNVRVPAHFELRRQPSWDAVRSILARLDTLQRGAIAEIRVEAAERITREVEERTKDARAAWEERSGDSHATRTLAAISEAVQLEIGTWRDNGIGPDELNDAVLRYIAADRDIHRAVDQLLNRYSLSPGAVRHAVTELERAIAAVKQLRDDTAPTQPMEVTA